ncbi:MAG: SGNH/GDSL hydrolase family protein [Ruminococcaceae bacterium]|nr:SGNH/GDSL hydrolase family protein [Oscillospiraceae bacterium]
MTSQEFFAPFINAGRPFTLKLLGDSITHGVGGTGFEQNGEPITPGYARNPDGYCWANQLRDYMAEKYNCTVINNACTGTTIEFILERFNDLVSPDDDVILCAIGTNNRHQYLQHAPMRSSDEQAERVYQGILKLHERFKAAGIPVLFMANIPADPENELSQIEYRRLIHMVDVNAQYKRAQKVCGFPLYSFYDTLPVYAAEHGHTTSYYLCDGLHPNDAGEDAMFELLKEALGV